MKINGMNTPLEKEITLEEFLQNKGYPLLHIAVERNGEIVPKGRYRDTILCDGDSLEVVRFVGGG